MGYRVKAKKKFFSFFIDCLSFNTPKAIVFNLTIILLILAIVPAEYLIYSPIRCVFKNFIFPTIFSGNCPTTGFFADCECPACGLTRGMSRLLHGDISSAIDYNVLVIPVFLLMAFFIVLNLIKIKKANHKLFK